MGWTYENMSKAEHHGLLLAPVVATIDSLRARKKQLSLGEVKQTINDAFDNIEMLDGGD